MDEKTRLLEQLDQARAALLTALEGLDPQTEIYPGWTAKHLLAHVTGWDEACTASLRAHAVGNEPGTPAVRGIDHYNAESVATREALSLEQVKRECALARQQFEAAIRDLPEEKFDQPLLFPWGRVGTIDFLVQIFVHHEREHAREIESLNLAQPRGVH